jgi:hypothetical protein
MPPGGFGAPPAGPESPPSGEQHGYAPSPGFGPPPGGGYAPPGPPQGYGPPPGPPGPGGYGPPPGPPGPAPGYGPPPAPAKSGGGCLKIFLIVLAVVVVLGVVTVGGLAFAGKRLWDTSVGTANADDYSLEAADMACTVSGTTLTATGTIRNRTDHNQAFRVAIDFVENGTKLGDDSAITKSLSAGESATFRASRTVSKAPRALTCKVTDVAYFFS